MPESQATTNPTGAEVETEDEQSETGAAAGNGGPGGGTTDPGHKTQTGERETTIPD